MSFSLWSIFCRKTVIEKPIKLTTELENYEILNKRKKILMQVQDYIDTLLNANKSSRIKNTTIDEVLKLLEMK